MITQKPSRKNSDKFYPATIASLRSWSEVARNVRRRYYESVRVPRVNGVRRAAGAR